MTRRVLSGALAVLIGLGVLPAITGVSRAAAIVAARPIPPPFEVSITDAGLVPDVITVAAGQTIHFTNDAAAARSVAADDGSFDSGPVPVVGRFVITIPSIATVAIHVGGVLPAPVGTITVGQLDLAGNPTDRWWGTLPPLPPPVSNDVDVQPTWGFFASRTRALVTFTDATSVADANATLAAANVTIIGGFPSFRVIEVAVGDTGTPGDFAALATTLASLAANPIVRAASYDFGLTPGEGVPRPASPDPGGGLDGDPSYVWDAAAFVNGAPVGAGGNFGLEASRFPQAWNWNDAIVKKGVSTVHTAVLDGGFDGAHPDLQKMQVLNLCFLGGLRCTANSSDPLVQAHGTSVAGIVGATFDNGPAGPASVGTVGANPFANVSLVTGSEAIPTGVRAKFVTSSLIADIARIVLAKAQGTIPNLRVINASLGTTLFAVDKNNHYSVPKWVTRFGTSRCGSGSTDDAHPAIPVPCTPNTEDGYLAEFAEQSELLRSAAETLAQANVLWVQSAGNQSSEDGQEATWCVPFGDPSCAFEVIKADNISPMARLDLLWGASPGTSPILSVGGYNQLLERDPMSNLSPLSAPAFAVTPQSGGGYRWFHGTSAAAPFVSGLAGYLLAFAPGLSTAQVKALIVGNARADLTGTFAHRIDAFATMLDTPGALKALLDVSDLSSDGNDRVVRDDVGNGLGEDLVRGRRRRRVQRARRSRRHPRLPPLPRRVAPGVPGVAGTRRDVPKRQEHRARRCSHPSEEGSQPRRLCARSRSSATCPTPEDSYARVDFNGDGTLARTASPVPIDATTGLPLPAGTTDNLTDLQVFQAGFTGADTQGLAPSQLNALMQSADVTVNTTHLVSDLGATGVSVQILHGSAGANDIPAVNWTRSDPLTISAPLTFATADSTDKLQVRVTGQVKGQDFTYLSPVFTAKAGQDFVAAPCSNQFQLAATPASIPHGRRGPPRRATHRLPRPRSRGPDDLVRARTRYAGERGDTFFPHGSDRRQRHRARERDARRGEHAEVRRNRLSRPRRHPAASDRLRRFGCAALHGVVPVPAEHPQLPPAPHRFLRDRQGRLRGTDRDRRSPRAVLLGGSDPPTPARIASHRNADVAARVDRVVEDECRRDHAPGAEVGFVGVVRRRAQLDRRCRRAHHRRVLEPQYPDRQGHADIRRQLRQQRSVRPDDPSPRPRPDRRPRTVVDPRRPRACTSRAWKRPPTSRSTPPVCCARRRRRISNWIRARSCRYRATTVRICSTRRTTGRSPSTRTPTGRSRRTRSAAASRRRSRATPATTTRSPTAATTGSGGRRGVGDTAKAIGTGDVQSQYSFVAIVTDGPPRARANSTRPRV